MTNTAAQRSSRNTLIKKFILFNTGLFFIALGIAFSVKADLGVSPISCVPYIYSLVLPFTVGELMIVLNLLFVIMQIGLLRRKYRLPQLYQLPAAVVFGYFIDLALYLTASITPESYISQLFWCIVSCLAVAIGILLEVKSCLTSLPGEGILLAIKDVFHKEFGKIKISFDCSMVLFGTISSSIILHELRGIREGTVISALLIGYFIKLLKRHILCS